MTSSADRLKAGILIAADRAVELGRQSRIVSRQPRPVHRSINLQSRDHTAACGAVSEAVPRLMT
jgi:hypothetical protein